MPITKKQTALALAAAALIGTLAYGEHQAMNPPSEGKTGDIMADEYPGFWVLRQDIRQQHSPVPPIPPAGSPCVTIGYRPH